MFSLQLRHHLPHRCGRPGRSLLPPLLQPLASVLDIPEKVRVFERRTPRGNYRTHAIPYHPQFAIALKKKLIVDQSAIHNGRHHLPVADYHADISVLLAALRIFQHHVLGRLRMKMFHEPRPRLAQTRLAPKVVETEHQIYFLIADLAHTSLLTDW